MSMISRIRERMTGYVGKDFMGRPLKVGDIVEPSPGTKITGEDLSCRLRVAGTGRHPHKGHHGILLVDTFDDRIAFATSTKALLKVEGDDKASWSLIEETVGWTPQEVEESQEVPA